MTDIEKFDKAVYAYLLEVSEKVIYAPTQLAIRTITKKEEFSDKKPWNFISYYRSSHFDIDWSRMNNPGTLIGDLTRFQADTESGEGTAQYVQSVPINLTYNVDIWASKATQALDLATKLFSKIFMESPDQVLKVPINPGGENGRFHILDPAWDDNSDIERETEIGKIYRHTISFTVESRITLKRDVPTQRFTCANVMSINLYDE